MGEGIKIITKNRKARHEYYIEDTLEAGLILQGTEVKAIREGRVKVDGHIATLGDRVGPEAQITILFDAETERTFLARLLTDKLKPV